MGSQQSQAGGTGLLSLLTGHMQHLHQVASLRTTTQISHGAPALIYHRQGSCSSFCPWADVPPKLLLGSSKQGWNIRLVSQLSRVMTGGDLHTTSTPGHWATRCSAIRPAQPYLQAVHGTDLGGHLSRAQLLQVSLGNALGQGLAGLA